MFFIVLEVLVATVKIFNNYLRIPLAALEMFVFAASVYGAAYISGWLKQEQVSHFSELFITELPSNLSIISMCYAFIMLTSMVALGHYKSHQYLPTGILTGTLLRVFISLLLGSMLCALLGLIYPPFFMERETHSITLVLSFLGIMFIRLLFLQTIETKVLTRHILVIGAGSRANKLIHEAGGPQDGVNYQIVGYVDFQNEAVEVPSNKVLFLEGSEIADYVLNHDIDEIILAIEDRRKTYPSEELLKCKLAGVRISDPVSFLEREQGKVNLEMLHADWMIYCSGFNRNDIKSILARTFDIVSSLVILLVMLPVILISAFIISAESGFGQPIFYRQTRVGLDGKEFTLFKFRSMKVDAEKGGEAVWAQENDNRITRAGHFIRKTRIDELPQILNILKGDMRLVGPRPERPEFVRELEEKIPHYKKRHTVKPGLAGWAQLNYPYGATVRDAYEKLQYDLYYVKNNNIILDLFILLQTIEIVLMGKGAR